MIEAFASDLALPVFLAGGFLGGLFGGSKTTVTTSTTVDLDIVVAPEIDIDVDTAPIAEALEDLGDVQAALFVTALGVQSEALAQQAAAITSFGADVGAGARTLALAGVAAVAAFLFFGDRA